LQYEINKKLTEIKLHDNIYKNETKIHIIECEYTITTDNHVKIH